MSELDKIYIYIRDIFKETKLEEKVIKNIKGKISNLSYFPFAHKLIRKTKNFEYRKFIIKNYIIIYKINLKKKKLIFYIFIIKDKKSKNKNYILKSKNNEKTCSNFVMPSIK